MAQNNRVNGTGYNSRDKIVVSDRSMNRGSGVRQADRVSGNTMKTNVRATNAEGSRLSERRNGETVTRSKKNAYEAQIDAYVQEELRKREKGRRFLILLCGLLGVTCLLYFGFYAYEDYRTRTSYEELAALKQSVSEETKLPEAGAVEQNAPMINYISGDKEPPEILDEYKNLYNMNRKLIGWLKIDDTNIDYPVMQTSDNEYYLDHNMNQEKDRNGALFLDKDCDVIETSTNLIIYGHHMKSGRMFGNLDDYASESYYKKHSLIQFDTIYEKGTYEVMYVFRSKVYSEGEVVFKYYQFIDCYSEQEFESNMKEMAALSLYDTGVTAEYGDKLLTLSTCDSTIDDGRFVVVAKRVN